MISKASASFVRISPRKVRYVIDMIREKSVTQAFGILNGSPRRAREIVQKLLDAAVDAAKKNSQISAEQLKISKIMADGGPTMKRFRAASMGRGMTIRKRTSHIYLELDLTKKEAVRPTAKNAKTSAKKETPGAGEAKKASKKPVGKKLVGAK